jgi:hypothetical protein
VTIRGRIVLGTAAGLILLFSLIVGGIITLSRTVSGREQVRRLVVSTLRQRVHGSIYVGHITDGFFSGVTIDSLEIRDPHDSLLVSTGPITFHYDLRDLVARRFLLRGVTAAHPVVHLHQYEDGSWNFGEVFKRTAPLPFQPKAPRAFLVLDSAALHDFTLVLSTPWHPSPWLKGAARDSAIRFELARPDHDISRTSDGFSRTWRWTHGNITLLHGRISHPDTAGSFFRFANLGVHEEDPPFVFSNVSGSVKQVGDSLWVDVPHLDLPASTAHGSGKIIFGSGLPVRYDIRLRGDSVSLNDVAWIYPTLPRTGGGTTDLEIRSDPKYPHRINFVLTNMDMRTERSHLLGKMTFVTGVDTLEVRDVQIAASPVNFDLLRTLNGKPFPYDWEGDLRGTVRASGGNLGRFRLENADITFTDANVPGAVSSGTAQGELNIIRPAFTEFHGLAVNMTALDLRTLQYLNSNFPRLNGTMSGTTVLDSSWMDVRFRDAQFTHRDGDGPESHVTGNGRVTWGEKYLTYDLDLQAQPVAFATLHRSYPHLPLRGELSGPIRVQGESPALRVAASLAGAGGTLAYDGVVDADPPGYGATGAGTLTDADLQTLLANPSLPHTSLTGNYAVDVRGDSLPNLIGTGSISLAQSTVGGSTILGSSARARFGNGVITIDTLMVTARGVSAEAAGSVATAAGTVGQLHYQLDVGSVAELEKLLGRSVLSGVSGKATLTGTLGGTPGALEMTGKIAANDVGFGTVQVAAVRGDYTFRDLEHAPDGVATLVGDSIDAGLVSLERASVALGVTNGKRAAFRADFTGTGSIAGSATGAIARTDSARTELRLDSASVHVDSLDSYNLAAPVHAVADERGVSIDSVIVDRSAGGSVALRNASVMGDSIRGSIRTRGFDLAFLELFGSAVTNLHGALSVNVDVSGTTAHPTAQGNVSIDSGSATVVTSGTRLDRFDANIALSGDTLLIRRLSAITNRERRGTLDLTGTVAFDRLSDPMFALQARASNFRAVSKSGLARLDVTTQAPITLSGPYSGAVVGGSLRVDRGTIYIPEVIRKRVIDLNDPELFDVVDTTLASDRSILPHAPSKFTRNLRLENVAVNIGDDVWLRSDEANIKIGGSLNVTLGRSASTGERSQLALEGQLNALRGTYRLNVVPFVQPTFDVEQGTLRFFGTGDLNPSLDITAINTVRRPRQSLNGQDVRIRATIGGTLSAPTLTLASADNLPLSQSDLLSYLITGEPAFTLDYTTLQYVNQLAAVAVRSAGNIISSAIPHSVFDLVELQTPTVLTPADAQTQAENSTLYNLLNTRAVFGKQLNSNLFLNFSTGFCAENFRNNLGLKLEYRLGRTYTAQFGIEPGSSDLVCARSGAVQSIQQTPPQVGLDFLRAWRF